MTVAAAARADRAEDLARIHLEALGGKARIAALGSLRATGHVIAGGKRVRFTMTAARPVRLRLETDAGGRTLVQGYDGTEGPWEFDTGTWPPHYQPLTGNATKTFVADAEFDDPLIGGAERGFTLEYGGEVNVDGKSLLRMVVTRNLVETYSLLLDADTYLIVLRVEQRTSPTGRTIKVVTQYDDYRPVNGVLLPHRLTVAIDGTPSQQTVIDSVEANPKTSADTFSRPKTAVPKSEG